MKTFQLKKAVSVLSIFALVSTGAWAGHDDDDDDGVRQAQYQDFARVRSVTPEYKRVNHPREECSNEYIPGAAYRNDDGYDGDDRSGRSYTGTIVGGIAGALLGSRVGKGNGNKVATAAGAIAGAVIGDQVQANGRSARHRDRDVYEDHGREVRRCRVVENWDNQLTGYRVVYEYAGRNYTALLPQDPGRQIPVRVSVTPAVERLSRNGLR